MTTLLIIVGAIFLYGVLHSAMDWLKAKAIEEERIKQAEADAELARKQAEIVAEHKTAEDVANELDRGDF